eukprot:974906-Prorocentrum_minimum.AAC.1
MRLPSARSNSASSLLSSNLSDDEEDENGRGEGDENSDETNGTGGAQRAGAAVGSVKKPPATVQQELDQIEDLLAGLSATRATYEEEESQGRLAANAGLFTNSRKGSRQGNGRVEQAEW